MIVDTSFLVALFIVEDELHSKAISQLEELENKELLVLDRVLEETFTVITYKKGINYMFSVLEKINKNTSFLISRLENNECCSVLELALKINKKLSFVDYAVLYLALKTNDSLLCFDVELNKLVILLKNKR